MTYYWIDLLPGKIEVEQEIKSFFRSKHTIMEEKIMDYDNNVDELIIYFKGLKEKYSLNSKNARFALHDFFKRISIDERKKFESEMYAMFPIIR
jgi:hypothetical protein